MGYYNYTWEAVKVHTEDGFILTTFHITGNSTGKFNATMPPVLLQHGDSSDGAYWFCAYHDYGDGGKPLHLQLADAGYDVWIGNNRGTPYSQKHENLTVSDPAFWKWSWAEMGIYDDVANI
jgi:lysosomal acid lipase/cholesteryl ester hydrolase